MKSKGLKKRIPINIAHMPAPEEIEKRFGELTRAFIITYGWGGEIKQKQYCQHAGKRSVSSVIDSNGLLNCLPINTILIRKSVVYGNDLRG